jgi:hypothetical protein
MSIFFFSVYQMMQNITINANIGQATRGLNLANSFAGATRCSDVFHQAGRTISTIPYSHYEASGTMWVTVVFSITCRDLIRNSIM